jgi:hypothetical protein
MPLALLLSLLAASSPPTELPPILALSIEHHGGLEAYRSLDLAFELCSKAGCSDVEVRHDGSRWDHRVTGERRGSTWTVHSTDRDLEVWQGGERMDVSPDEEPAWRDWVSSKVWFSLLPFRLADPSVRWEDRGVVDWDGRRLHELRVSFEAGSSTDAADGHRYWFDPETGRLERFAYDFRGRPDGVRYRELVDYRRVGGILLFDQRNLGLERDGVRVDDLVGDLLGELREISRVQIRRARVLSGD